jgi:hypothetical protein
MKYLNMTAVVTGMLVFFACVRSSLPQDTTRQDSQEASGFAGGYLENFIAANYHTYVIDTAGAEAMIAVSIVTNGDFHQLDSLGIRTIPRSGNRVTTRIPVALMATVSDLESVVYMIPGSRAVNLLAPRPDSGKVSPSVSGR